MLPILSDLIISEVPYIINIKKITPKISLVSSKTPQVTSVTEMKFPFQDYIELFAGTVSLMAIRT